MSEEQQEIDWFKTIVVGLALTCTVGFLGWIGTSVNAMAERLTTIEVTMRENKAEREAQIADLRNRVNRIEDRMEIGRIDRNGVRQ
jgi:hypothetical protein